MTDRTNVEISTAVQDKYLLRSKNTLGAVVMVVAKVFNTTHRKHEYVAYQRGKPVKIEHRSDHLGPVFEWAIEEVASW